MSEEQIAKRRQKLVVKKELIEIQLAVVRAELMALTKVCDHKKATTGCVMGDYSMSCPTCGHSS